MAVPIERRPTAGGALPRIINVVLGVWLFISAFAWPHTHAQRTNTWIAGVLAVIFALSATTVPWARYLNTLLAIWLFISAWALPTLNAGTVWNNVLVAIAIFVVSLVPSETTRGAPGFFDRTAPPRPA
jgi:multisubunit Na+/H+ antiporter MnhB subunit